VVNRFLCWLVILAMDLWLVSVMICIFIVLIPSLMICPSGLSKQRNQVIEQDIRLRIKK